MFSSIIFVGALIPPLMDAFMKLNFITWLFWITITLGLFAVFFYMGFNMGNWRKNNDT